MGRRLTATVHVLLEADDTPARTESGLVCAFVGPDVPEAWAALAAVGYRAVQATIAYAPVEGRRVAAVEISADAEAPAPAPRPARAATRPPVTTADADGVPDDVKPTARAAYLEGCEARRGGQGRDLNPFTANRGIAGARRLAWLRGWDDAA